MNKSGIDSEPTISRSKDFYDLFYRSANRVYQSTGSVRVKSFIAKSTNVDIIESADIVSEPLVDFNSSIVSNSVPNHLDRFNLYEGVQLPTWRLEASISSKVLAVDGETVLLDCLIDKECGLYEEREFSVTLFEGFTTTVGSLFKVCVYKRQNQQMIEIKDGTQLVSPEDFPKIDFFAKFGDLDLEKKVD